MIDQIIVYSIIGIIWSMWLEYYTTNNINGNLGRPWVSRERFFHLCLWPISLGTFIYEFFRYFFEDKDE